MQMATLREAGRLAKRWHKRAFVKVERLPVSGHYWSEAVGQSFDDRCVERADCTAPTRRAAMAGLCAALSALVEEKR
jgi:hypothetical protein